MRNVFACLLALILPCRVVLAARGAEVPVIVIAHRGNHENAHENTLEAIRDAISAGADYVELDVRRSKDGHHVLMHDRTLKRMTGVDRMVSDLTLKELRELKVADLQRTKIPASKIPTLDEALSEIGTKIGFYLDFKEGDPAQIFRALQQRNLTKKTFVYVGDDGARSWRAVEPGVQLIMSLPDQNRSTEGVLSFIKTNPGVVLDGPITDYTIEMVRAAHANGAKVWPDIQSSTETVEQWDAAVALGIDGLQTDHPSALVRWLKDAKRR